MVTPSAVAGNLRHPGFGPSSKPADSVQSWRWGDSGACAEMGAGEATNINTASGSEDRKFHPCKMQNRAAVSRPMLVESCAGGRCVLVSPTH